MVEDIDVGTGSIPGPVKSDTLPTPLRFLGAALAEQPVSVAVKDIAIDAGDVGAITCPVKSDTASPTARHRCDFEAVLPRR